MNNSIFKKVSILFVFIFFNIISLFAGIYLGAYITLNSSKITTKPSTKKLYVKLLDLPNKDNYKLYGTEKYYDCNSLMNNSDWWNTYRSPAGDLYIKYPFCISIFEPDARMLGVEFKNFVQKPSHAFPYANYYDDKEFFMEIKTVYNPEKFNVRDWLNSLTNNGNVSGEEVQIVDEKSMPGEFIFGSLIKEKEIKVAGKEATQRILSYKGKKDDIRIVFTYVSFNDDTVLKIISHSGTEYALTMYSRMLDTLRIYK